MRPRIGIAGALAAFAATAGGLWPPAAPAQAAQPPRQPPKFERIEDSPYLVLYWTCKKAGARSLVVEGLAEVPFRTASNIYRGEVTLVGLDAKGKRVSEATGYLPPVLHMTSSAPFTVALGLTGSEARVDLDYGFDFATHRGTDLERRSQAPPRLLPVAMGNFRWSVRNACPAP
jgi:hypothetical protein